MRSRRGMRRPPDLTSLFDVLFIVVFAALIRAAAVENAAAHPTPAPAPAPPPPGPRAPEAPPAVAALRQRALADLDAALAARAPLVVRITRDGTIEAIEADGRKIALVVPLLEHDPDPNIVVTYAGDRSPDLQVCRIAARRLGIAELSRYLVIMAPAVPVDDLPEALFEGLLRDIDRCLLDQRGQAALVALPPTPTRPPAAPPAPTIPPRATP